MKEHYFEPQKGVRPWDQMDIMLLIVGIILVPMMIVSTYLFLNPNELVRIFPGNSPPAEMLIPGILIGFFGILLFFVAVQKIMGVSGYSLDEGGIVVHNRIWNTRIQFIDIEYVKFDSLYAFTSRPKGGRGQLMFWANEEDCDVKGTGLFFGPYISVREGPCVSLKLKKDGSRIALTPKSLGEMYEQIRAHLEP